MRQNCRSPVVFHKCPQRMEYAADKSKWSLSPSASFDRRASSQDMMRVLMASNLSSWARLAEPAPKRDSSIFNFSR